MRSDSIVDIGDLCFVDGDTAAESLYVAADSLQLCEVDGVVVGQAVCDVGDLNRRSCRSKGDGLL